MELRDRAAVLTEYIARRGIALPNDFLKLRVVFVNEMSRPEQDILLLPEVVSYDRWEDIRSKASSSSIFGMNSHLNSSLNSDVALCNQLHYILNTAPTWDRLKLRGGGLLFGKFVRFKGASQSLEALNVAKRSKISHYEAIHKWSFLALLGIHPVTEVKMICHLRDSRQGISAQPDKFEVCVQGDFEVVFQPLEAAKPRTIELREISSLSLYT
ncbi:hypothetical protein KP509_1Z082100 [Ceratopteris richardii]|nr:hypothetical protein KP509_1Z082100 [Ceratopteris richardii]